MRSMVGRIVIVGFTASLLLLIEGFGAVRFGRAQQSAPIEIQPVLGKEYRPSDGKNYQVRVSFDEATKKKIRDDGKSTIEFKAGTTPLFNSAKIEKNDDGTRVFALDLSSFEAVRSVDIIATFKPTGDAAGAVVSPDLNVKFTTKVAISYLPGDTVTSGPLVKTNSYQVKAEVAPAGAIKAGRSTIQFSASGVKLGQPSTFNANGTITIDLGPIENRGTVKLNAAFREDKDSVEPDAFSDSIDVNFDTEGPFFRSTEIQEGPGNSLTLIVRTLTPDLGNVKSGILALSKIEANGIPAAPSTLPGDAIISGDSIQLPLQPLAPGVFRIEATTDAGTKVPVLKDKAGNPAGKQAGVNKIVPQTGEFSYFPNRSTGPHVEFPPFTPPAQGKNPNQPFNPDDFVETRVARLYYFRDAHRVAQIINRNTKSYNRAAVTQRQRTAETARETADKLTDDRRQREREAVRAGEELRRTERELATAQEDLRTSQEQQIRIQESLDRLNQETADLTKKIEALTAEKAKFDDTDDKDQKERTRIQAEIDKTQSLIEAHSEEKRRLTAIKTSVDLKPGEERNEITRLQNQLTSQRNAMLDAKEKSDQAQASEDRAREDQFRKEVAAAQEDPDTYVPGNIDSQDPVSQVSISVIGEGLIQLRGPIKGINKIRTMINQIDSPVGQVKVGIFTVQVNGERANRMEGVVGKIEGEVDVARFLTSQSLLMFRRAVQEVASQVAEDAFAQFNGYTQTDRDRRYLYSFFGRDFVDSLFAMNSEFLFSGNRVLSLNSMDNISLNRALFAAALAKNDIRERIMLRFQELIKCELPKAEFEFRRTNKNLNCGPDTLKECYKRAAKYYNFRSLHGHFGSQVAGADTLNPMQAEFIRLAQIFKSQMVSEVELKQRIVERGLIQDDANDDQKEAAILGEVQDGLRIGFKQKLQMIANSDDKLSETLTKIYDPLMPCDNLSKYYKYITSLESNYSELNKPNQRKAKEAVLGVLENEFTNMREQFLIFTRIDGIDPNTRARYQQALKKIDLAAVGTRGGSVIEALGELTKMVQDYRKLYNELEVGIKKFRLLTLRIAEAIPAEVGAAIKNGERTEIEGLYESWLQAYKKIRDLAGKIIPKAEEKETATEDRKIAYQAIDAVKAAVDAGYSAVMNVRRQSRFKRAVRARLDHRKLLDHLIDEKEEKYIELMEGTRSYIAVIDGYLKRLTVALEDDCKVQYYDPMFAEVRKASRQYDVNLGQVERTTILTNNRAFAKVSPQATMEFDLPKRDILIQEAMKGAKGLVQDYGALLQDPTFLAATGLLSGQPPASGSSPVRPSVPGLLNQGQGQPLVKDVLPTLPSGTEQQILNQTGNQRRELGAALESLIPDPAIYKFETGTGFEIRPVIQPDGDSIIYDFNYMYTTNVREPVRPDEKHLGRVKRHFINTQVQTSTYEMREISRYQVALKASRTSRGVPLLEDAPGVGVLFRPLPSDESSLQQNIILGQSTVYPTVFDLMGLRWAPQIVDSQDSRLLDEEFVVRGRRKSISDFVFDEASRRVDDFANVGGELRRPDLYRTQDRPSPHHPGGFSLPNYISDPNNRGYEVRDRRPPELRDPPFDTRTGRLVETYPPLPGEVIAPLIEYLPNSAPTSESATPRIEPLRDRIPRISPEPNPAPDSPVPGPGLGSVGRPLSPDISSARPAMLRSTDVSGANPRIPVTSDPSVRLSRRTSPGVSSRTTVTPGTPDESGSIPKPRRGLFGRLRPTQDGARP